MGDGLFSISFIKKYDLLLTIEKIDRVTGDGLRVGFSSLEKKKRQITNCELF